MAIWLVTSDLKGTYTGADGVVQECGQADDGVLRPEVMAWVISSAAVGDLVRTPEGIFVRQQAPGARQ